MQETIVIPTSGIYKITCIANNKIYIGSAIDLRNRKYKHFGDLSKNKHHSIYLQRAWNKYGSDAFTFEVIEYVLPISLIAREQYWLNKLKPFGTKGYNSAREAGSRLGMKNSPEHIEKSRQATTGRKRSPEEIERIRQSMIGKKRTPEHIENSRQARLGKKRPPGVMEKVRQANLGRKHTPETRAKMSQSQKKAGHGKHNIGRKHTHEELEKMRQAAIRRRKQ